jgi:TRAP-type C4-dicarboxylate transport system permease small subunit
MNKFFNFWFIVERVTSIILISLIVVLFSQVISRYIFHLSIYWSEEVARFIFIYFVLMGACIVNHKKEHIKITYFYYLLSRRNRKIIRIINEILILFFLTVLFFLSIKLVFRSFNTLSQALEIPYAYIYLACTISAIIMFFDRIFSIFKKDKSKYNNSEGKK